MNSLLVFDVDGTLTGPRQRMHEDFSGFFGTICRNYEVFLVSGSDMFKLENQLPGEIIRLVSGIFPCSGNEMFEMGRCVYRMEHSFPLKMMDFLEQFLADSDYPERVGNHLEKRAGMLNVSIVGRNADFQQRMKYFAHDTEYGERQTLIREVAHRFPDYEANMGGQISVDITPRGWNKSRVFTELSKRHPKRWIAFFGDNMQDGGNDQPLGNLVKGASSKNRVFSVKNYHDTWKILQDQFCSGTCSGSWVA